MLKFTSAMVAKFRKLSQRSALQSPYAIFSQNTKLLYIFIGSADVVNDSDKWNRKEKIRFSPSG